MIKSDSSLSEGQIIIIKYDKAKYPRLSNLLLYSLYSVPTVSLAPVYAKHGVNL